MAKKRSRIGLALIVVVIAVGAVGVAVWRHLTGPATDFKEESRLLFVPTGADFQTVVDSLVAMEAITDPKAFHFLAEQKKYAAHVKPGRYRVPRGISMNELVDKLRAGEQEPVRVSFTNVKRLHELAGRLGRTLEPDSLAFLRAFLDPDRQQDEGLSDATRISLFVPNTYELWWTTTPERFITRMRKEHDLFWNEDRRQRAKTKGLSPTEVSTLAAIVQAETGKKGDAPNIAGVYLNRIRIGMPLQADPTLKFANGLDTIQRVLNADKETVSPYNTYKNVGLPPGPINMPEPWAIDAVLQAPKHDYLYFCARADLSGYTDFSKSYEQHLVNARRYHRALNARGIRR